MTARDATAIHKDGKFTSSQLSRFRADDFFARETGEARRLVSIFYPRNVPKRVQKIGKQRLSVTLPNVPLPKWIANRSEHLNPPRA